MDPDLHARLDRLVGTWRTTGRIVEEGDHHGARWGGQDVYTWFPGERHLVHHVDVEILGSRTQAIEMFTPRADGDGTFDQTSYDADGSVEHAVGSFDAEDRYVNDAGEARALLTFDGADAMQAVWERRLDDGSWIPWMEVDFIRVDD